MKKTNRTKGSTEKRVTLAVTGLAPFEQLDGNAPRFKKEVLRAGSWIHPGTGEALEFDVPLLERLAQDTNRWIELGQKVHFPAGPDCHEEDARDARANLGYWSNFRVEDERLVADVSVLDASVVPKIGNTIQDVSPEIRWPARAATGETLEAAIFHVAATPIPAIPGQKNFERLSQLAREAPMAGKKSSGSKKREKGSKEVDVLAWARSKLSLPADAPPKAVVDALAKKLDVAAAPIPAADKTALAQLTRDMKDARAEALAAKTLVSELREQRDEEKRRRDKETVRLARHQSAKAGVPIPEDTCKLALALFSKNEDEAARQLLSAHEARAKDRTTVVRVLAAESPMTKRASLGQDAADKLLLERDGWVVKTRKGGRIKRDANGRPLLVRRNKEER